jgi:hypothetical protein
MSTILPTDENNNPIPALRLRDGAAHKITVTATSARTTTPFNTGTRVVSLYATGPVYVRCGGSGVNATTNDHYFPAHTYYDIAIGGEEAAQTLYIAAIRADTDCMLYISEKA